VTGRQFLVLIAIAAALAPTSASLALASRSTTPTAGRDLYRKFCGQCHAFKAARAVGFGSNKSGLGKLGGPSFDELRIPYAISVRHVTQPTGGHEGVRTKITLKQLHVVATFIATRTRHNPIPALPTDG
jgi:mono/diheme cytochrome c family protein